MQAAHYIHVLWVFILGIAIVVVGLTIMLLLQSGMYTESFPEVGYDWTSISFMIMVLGLAIGGIGAIRGKRKLQMGLYTESPWFQDMQQKKDFTAPITPASPMPAREEPIAPPQTQMQQIQPRQPEPEKPKSFFDIQKQEVHEPVNEQEMLEEMTEIEHDIAPSDVIRIVVCPKCGLDNPEDHVFCSRCGKKLKSAEKKVKTKKAVKKKKEKKKARKPKKKAKK